MRVYISILLLFYATNLFSQSTNRISGYVTDINSNESLIGASIYLLPSKKGVISNEFGFFSIEKSEKDTAIVVRFYGYNQVVLKISEINIEKCNISLGSKTKTFEEVVVIGQEKIMKNPEMGSLSIPIEEMKLLPNLFGEVDVIKSYQLTPGVQSGGESSSDFYVRGGSNEQNLIILDDVPLYNVSHFGGFFSIFNSDIVQNSTLYKSSFPARYGGRLSSVLDIRMREGNSKQKILQGSVGLLSTRLAFESPLIKNKASFILSARTSILPIFRIFGEGIGFNFNDINAKFNYKSSEKNKFYISFYRGRDGLTTRNKSELSNLKTKASWGNTMISGRWNHRYGSKLFSNLVLYASNYSYSEELKFEDFGENNSRTILNNLESGVNDIGAKFDFTHFTNNILSIRFGANTIYHKFTPNNLVFEQFGSAVKDTSYLVGNSLGALESGVYAELEAKFKRFRSNIGVRFSNYLVNQSSYFMLEPRASLNYIVTENISLKYSATIMNQYVHLLAYSGTGLPSDYWMPSTDEVKPSRGIQNSAGLYFSLFKDKFVVSSELYHKSSNNIIAFKQGESLVGSTEDWQNIIETNGTNNSYGLEFMVTKKHGETRGWISATYARSFNQFENLNNGNPFPFKYDRPLTINLVFIHEFNKDLSISTTWTYGTGYPITLPNEVYVYNGNTIFEYEGINNFRMRDYHRMDIALSHKKTVKWGERTWSFSIFNLYNRQNPYYYFFRHDVTSVEIPGGGFTAVQGDLKLYQQSLFSFFPSFSYSFKINSLTKKLNK